MGFFPVEKKGLRRFLVDEQVDPNKLSVHISEIGPGSRAHPPHQHEGLEVFYIMAGHGSVEVEEESHPLGPNEAILIDPTRRHGIVNTGSTPMRYMVIISRL